MDAYRESISLDPSEANAEAYVNLASLQRTANDPAGAERTILEAARVNPRNPAFRLYLAEMYAAYGDTLKAAENIRWLKETADSSAAVLDRVGQLAFKLDQIDLADSIFADELALAPESALGNYYRGRIAFMRNRNSEAKGYFLRLIEVADSIPDGYINLGLVYLSDDSTDEAIEVLQKGVERASNGREDAQYYLATAFGRAERYGEVIGIADALASKHPEEIRFLFMLGSALERTKEYDSAAVVFERILKIDPNHAQTLNYLGYMWADIGVNLEKSLMMIEKALELDGDNGAYLDSYGWALYRLGRLEDASKQIEKAISLGDETDPVIFEHLGDVYYGLGQHDKAKEQWQKALSMDPENAQLKEKLAR
jgi:tetratricopeptide (TPR) repeat protein